MDSAFLRQVPILKNLTDSDLVAFADLIELREVQPKERIIKEGTVIESFYIVGKGTVHVRRLAQKREVLLGRIAAGGFFGEINLFDPGETTASIYAMDQVTLGVIPYEKMRAFMSENPAAGYTIVSTLLTEVARRLRQTNERLVNSVYWSSLSVTPPS